MRALKRIKGMMFHPSTEWDAIAADKPGALELLRSFLLPLSLLAPIATAVGMLVFDTGWNPEYGYSMQRDRAPAIAIGTYTFQIASVYLLSAVFYLLARTEGRSPSFLSTFQVAVLGSIPVLLAGATLVIPFNVIFTMMAMLYSFYLYYLGAVQLIGIRPSDATMFVGIAMICMLMLSGIVGGMVSMLGLI